MTTREFVYRCRGACLPEGCPLHITRITHLSRDDTYALDLNGREIVFRRNELNELEAIVSLLKKLAPLDAGEGDKPLKYIYYL